VAKLAMAAGQGEEVEVGHARGREERGPGQMGGSEQGDVVGQNSWRGSAQNAATTATPRQQCERIG